VTNSQMGTIWSKSTRAGRMQELLTLTWVTRKNLSLEFRVKRFV